MNQVSLIYAVLLLVITSASLSAETERMLPEQKIFTAAAFGPDGRLWRIIPSQKYISVDYSTDFGKSFSQPVRVNSADIPIHLWDENPPTLSVDRKGKVYVLYFANDEQASTSFFSHSDDGTQFSQPIKISSEADNRYHYQTEMIIDAADRIHFAWHDVRDRDEYKKLGGGDLSIYHVSARTGKAIQLASDQRIAKNVCSCCRTAMAEDIDGSLIILARFVYPGNIRDHGLFRLSSDGKIGEPWRVTFDDWVIEGCPAHGPALSISADGRYHMTWFTQGEKRSGLFYAWSDDQGRTFSSPMPIGDQDKLPGRAEVLALGKQVALVWKVFDGMQTRVEAMYSMDGGLHWSAARSIAESSAQSAHPALITDGKQIFLSWNSLDTGYRLIPVKQSDSYIINQSE
jgi:hypothetical protein